MTKAAPVADVIRYAQESGIPQDVFVGWTGEELALYKDTGGRSASPEVATQVAHDKAAREAWVLDLGNRAVSLPREQGEKLRTSLDKAGVQYETGSLSHAYLKRVHRVTRDHQDILRELSKR